MKCSAFHLLQVIAVAFASIEFVGCGGEADAPQPAANTVLDHAPTPDLIETLKANVEGGNLDAMVELGRRHFEGDGLPQDDGLAIILFRQAADQHHAKAMRYLGIMIHQGRGVEPVYKQAIHWYLRAAKGYDVEAMKLLGIMKCVERDITKDYDEAMAWFNRAAGSYGSANSIDAIYFQKGERLHADYAAAFQHFKKAAVFEDPEAMCMVGRMLELGVGVDKDVNEAKQWYLKGVNKSSGRAMANLGLWYRTHPYADEGRTPEPVRKEAKAQEVHWFEKAAKQGNAAGMYWLGLNRHGEGKLDECLALYQQALDAGDRNAMLRIGMMRRIMGLDPKDSAMKSLHDAATAGSDAAMAQLGDAYLHGREGLTVNHAKAFELFTQAAKQVNVDANFGLATIHHHGMGVEKNMVEALRLYRKAAALGDVYSLDELGRIYEEGDGVERDDRKALAWFRIGLAHDSNESELAVARIEKRLAGKEIVPAKYADLHRMLQSLGRVQVDVMEAATSPEIEALTLKFQKAIAADQDWWMEHVQKAKPGQTLPYDPRIGLTREEYDLMVKSMNNLKLRKQRTATVTVGRRAEGVYMIEGDDTLPALSGVMVDLANDKLSSLYADVEGGAILDSKETALVGAVNGAKWRVNQVTDEGKSIVSFTFALGKLKGSNRGLIYVKAITVTPQARNNVEYILYLDLPDESK